MKTKTCDAGKLSVTNRSQKTSLSQSATSRDSGSIKSYIHCNAIPGELYTESFHCFHCRRSPRSTFLFPLFPLFPFAVLTIAVHCRQCKGTVQRVMLLLASALTKQLSHLKATRLLVCNNKQRNRL